MSLHCGRKPTKIGGGDVQSLRRKAQIRSQLAGGFKPFLHRYAVSYLSPPTFSISLTKYDTSAWPFWSVILLYISLYCNSVSSIYLWHYDSSSVSYEREQVSNPQRWAVLWSHQRAQPGAAPLRISQRWLCECRVCIFILCRQTGFILLLNYNHE